MAQSVVTYTGGQVPAPIGHRNTGGEAEEEWVTKKKVDIVTTKSVERKVQRQIVLEDGRVVEEEVPVVTVDTTEDTQTFQTDQDEERELAGGQEAERSRSLANKFDTTGNVLVGDKFTRVKKINDVTESLVKTEALQNLGDIRSKDLKKCLDERDDIRKYLRSRVGSDSQVIVAPKVLLNKRNHRVVTDQEDVQERNWMNKGKMQNERIKTEEHIEYDSDDSSESGSSSSSKSSHNKLEPEVYKTRKDENFTEYFKIHKNQPKNIKIGEGPHYVSESKEVHRVDDNQLLFTPSRPSRARNQRNFLLTDYEPSRRPLNHTDSWLEKHFGSTSSLSQSSSELTGSRPGSRDGPGAGTGGLRRSASICDIRPVANSSGEFYATVRKSGKVPVPEVPMRESRGGGERNYYTENRRSANFSSSGHPVPIRPPRRQKSGGQYGYSSLSRGSGSQSSDRHYSSLSFRKPADHNPTEKYYFGAPVTIKKYPGAGSGSGGLTRSYSSVQNIPGHTGGHTGRRPEHHSSTGNIYKSASVATFRKSEPHHLIVNRDKPRPEHREPRYKSESRDREKYHNGNVREQYTLRDRDVSGGGYLQERTNNIRNRGDIYSVPHKVTSSGRDNKSYKSSSSRVSDIYTIGRDHHQDIAREVYAVPHQIIYDTTTQGTPFTKFRTRIVINSET